MRSNHSICRVTVDGVDFSMYEPSPFNPKWLSHKFNGPGLRYEIGICIQTSWVVWINGPFPPSDYPDISIARDGINDELDPGEKYLADGGYADGNQYSTTPDGINDHDHWMKAKARARHEAVNHLFKNWGILERRFRHNKLLHGKVFGAVANLVQASIMTGHPVFDVRYKDRR